MNDTVDLLQIKIEKARRELPTETINAINAVDWREAILALRTKKGYTFEQLGDLELETELLLCGLLAPEDYPKEIEKRMGISKIAANELADEMNNSVFKKIREELIKNTERKKVFQKRQESQKENSIFSSAGIEIVGEKDIHPMLLQKLSTSVQTPTIKTTHTLENITPKIDAPVKPTPSVYPPKADPYRLSPE